ncbi:MAG: rod shape-determining protein MreC [Acidimicrobiales bacterium]
MAVYRRSSRARYVLAILVLAAVTLVTLDARSGNSGLLNHVRNTARDAFTPIQHATHTVLEPIGNFLTGALDYGALRRQNQQLRSEVAALQAKGVRAAAEQTQAEQILALEHLPFIGSIPNVAADVISQGSSNFETAVTIDKGTASGIAVGQPVVASGGLVGIVQSAGTTTSTVELLTDPTFAVGVDLGPGNTGSAQGFGRDQLLRVTVDTPGAPPPVLRKGQAVVTSGLSLEKFPKNIPVGTVERASTPPGSAEPVIRLAPLVNLNQLSYVEVLLWSPQ